MPGIAQEITVFLVDAQVSPGFCFEQRHPDGRLLEESPETALALLQRLFGLLALGHVRIGAAITQQVSPCIQHRRAGQFEDNQPAIFVNELDRYIPIGLFFRVNALESIECCLAGGRSKQVIPMLFLHQFIRGVTQDLLDHGPSAPR